MIRLMGAALLSAAAVLLGFGSVVRLRRRTEDLRGLRSGLSAMERSLADRSAPLSEVLQEGAVAACGTSRDFFSFCAKGIPRLEGRPFVTLWEASLEGTPLTLELEDRRVLAELGPVLGRFDSESQTMALRTAVDRLERQAQEAVEQQRRLSKVYGSLGISAGLLLMIILL